MRGELDAGRHALLQLERAIAAGEFRSGAPLPSERILARELRVHRNAVREAKARLIERGILQRHGRRVRLPPLGELDHHRLVPWAEPTSGQLLEARRGLWAVHAQVALRGKRRPARVWKAMEAALSALATALVMDAPASQLAGRYAEIGLGLARATRNPALFALELQLQRSLSSRRSLWMTFGLLPRFGTRPEQLLHEALVAHHRSECRAVLRGPMRSLDAQWLAEAREWESS